MSGSSAARTEARFLHWLPMFERFFPDFADLLPFADVQFWQTENRRRLDRAHCRGHNRNTAHLVDAANVRAVTALKN